jgi:hypothetical protein
MQTTGSVPPSEQARYQPRFRVVARKAPVRRRSPLLNPVYRTVALAVFPALFLLVYVLFWTLAMRGGYYKGQLQARLDALRIEQAELQVEKRRLQSPGLILHRAGKELGMQPAGNREYARVSDPKPAGLHGPTR